MKLYSRLDTKDTYFELWGGSTKHPDVRRMLKVDTENKKFIESSLIVDVEYKFFQWVCQCLSELNFGTYTELTNFLEMCKPYFTIHNSTVF